ncbi:MAG: DNA/RNA nuclease SfsA [Clostridia bacterium]|nr:DNA/RNA nuclease SfsA [Clostridia bacterium]
MIYENIKAGIFEKRPNRFIAEVFIDGKKEICHVKNTGRCRELLTKGARVVVTKADNPDRKTKYDLIAVYKGDVLFNIDSQAPNKVFFEWLKKTDYFGEITKIKPECRFGESRLDFYFEKDGKGAFAEIKGVTLERDGVFLFPDAPTQRGAKHLKELCACKGKGYDAYAVFVLQAEGAKYFLPNKETDPKFFAALKEAEEKGVEIIAVYCNVTEGTLEIAGFVEVRL